LDELVATLYTTLRRIAGRALKGSDARCAVSATDLVHDCYLKLTRAKALEHMPRTEFVALASRALRNVLVDRARAMRSLKRGGRRRRVTLYGDRLPLAEEIDLLDLDVALQKLALLDERQSRVVELRFFGGLTQEEIAQVLDCSVRTVNSEWAMAKAWLHRELSRD
jgi:RNA polymerase sigma factor (TIGR02999 family)